MSAFYQRVREKCTINMNSNPVGCAAKVYYQLPGDVSDQMPQPADAVSWLEGQAKKACQDACGVQPNAIRRRDHGGTYFILNCGAILASAADPSSEGTA